MARTPQVDGADPPAGALELSRNLFVGARAAADARPATFDCRKAVHLQRDPIGAEGRPGLVGKDGGDVLRLLEAGQGETQLVQLGRLALAGRGGCQTGLSASHQLVDNQRDSQEHEQDDDIAAAVDGKRVARLDKEKIEGEECAQRDCDSRT